ncbi:MAG: hypothetical protein ABIG61_04040 [Planctomycetota bacterium]
MDDVMVEFEAITVYLHRRLRGSEDCGVYFQTGKMIFVKGIERAYKQVLRAFSEFFRWRINCEESSKEYLAVFCGTVYDTSYNRGKSGITGAEKKFYFS